MPYRVQISERAKRELRHLPKELAARIIAEATALADNPRPRGCQKLAGADLYRIRVGDYRIIYNIQDAALIVLVIRVGHRREIYR